MKKDGRNPVAMVFLITIIALLVILTVNSFEQKGLQETIAAMNDTRSSQNATIAAYSSENTRLKEELTAVRQYAADLKLYAENRSSEVIYVPQYYEQTTVKEVQVAQPVYVNGEWREFESVARLTEWAKEHLAYLWVSGDNPADCDDYAERLQAEAFQDGYLLSLQIIQGGVLNEKIVSNYTSLHMGNLAMIGNEIYFIEPQPDFFRIVFVCYRD